MRFQDSETFENLQTVYQDELKAASRYRLYAMRAEEEGKQSVAQRFSKMSVCAMTHAAILLKKINGGMLPTTLHNLRDAAQGEFGEWTREYSAYAKTASQEGFHDLAHFFDRLADISRYHNVCFCRMADAMEEGCMYLREEDTVWTCLSCGYIHTDAMAPAQCPVCGRPQGWFEEIESGE